MWRHGVAPPESSTRMTVKQVPDLTYPDADNVISMAGTWFYAPCAYVRMAEGNLDPEQLSKSDPEGSG